MNPIHIHLALNHVPLLGVLFGLGLLLAAVPRRSDEWVRAGLWALALSALASIPVFLSGEGAEALAKPLLGLPEALVERHEEAAELVLWLVLPLGALSLWTLWRCRGERRIPSRVVLACFALALACAAALGRAAALGGQIRHPEIQPDWKETAARGRPAQARVPGED